MPFGRTNPIVIFETRVYMIPSPCSPLTRFPDILQAHRTEGLLVALEDALQTAFVSPYRSTALDAFYECLEDIPHEALWQADESKRPMPSHLRGLNQCTYFSFLVLNASHSNRRFININSPARWSTTCAIKDQLRFSRTARHMRWAA